LDTPWNELDADTKKKFLYGTGKEKVDLSYIDERGRKHNRVQPFEGILPHLERRYRETESNASDDLPEPESPVITTNLSRGISRFTFFKLWVRAPRIRI